MRESVRRLRVLHIITRLNIGGAAQQVAVLHRALHAEGFETLLVYGRTGPGEGTMEDVIARTTLPARALPELQRAISPWRDLGAFIRLLRLMFAFEPDIVHTHMAKAGLVGRLSALLYNLTRPRHRRCLVVHTFHGHVLSGYFGRTGNLAARVAERALGVVTDRIVAVSSAQLDELSDRFGVAPRRKMALVPYGLELEPLLNATASPAAGRALGIDPGDLTFGYVGRFVPIKDLGTLVRAFARVAAEVPRARLVLVGDGELRPEIERLARELGIADRVRLAGWQRDLPLIYAALDVVVLSSLNEGTPVSLIEAMAAGRPVIATAVGGVPDVVQDGQTGLIVTPGDPSALATAMLRLAADAGERTRLGAAARSDAAGRFTSRRSLCDIRDLYRSGLASKRGLGSGDAVRVPAARS